MGDRSFPRGLDNILQVSGPKFGNQQDGIGRLARGLIAYSDRNAFAGHLSLLAIIAFAKLLVLIDEFRRPSEARARSEFEPWRASAAGSFRSAAILSPFSTRAISTSTLPYSQQSHKRPVGTGISPRCKHGRGWISRDGCRQVACERVLAWCEPSQNVAQTVFSHRSAFWLGRYTKRRASKLARFGST